MTEKRTGKNVKLEYKVGSDWIELTALDTIATPSMSVGKVEVTDLASVGKEYIPDDADPGDVSGTVYYDPNDAGIVFLHNSLRTGAVVEWKITFPHTGNDEYEFDGFVSAFSAPFARGSAVMANFTIALTALPAAMPTPS